MAILYHQAISPFYNHSFMATIQIEQCSNWLKLTVITGPEGLIKILECPSKEMGVFDQKNLKE